MKKLIVICIVAFFATSTFAQDNRMDPTHPEKNTTINAGKMPECYKMKDGSLKHCTGDKEDLQTKAVTLKNGTTISPSGEIKTKDGRAAKLENGQCITMMGSIGDCERMSSMGKPKGTNEVKEIKDEEVK